jgi:hypothetical protein
VEIGVTEFTHPTTHTVRIPPAPIIAQALPSPEDVSSQQKRHQLGSTWVPIIDALTLQRLGWLAEHPRSYPETIDAWKSSCPRLTVWEDAIAEGLVRVEGQHVVLTAAGEEFLPARFQS